MRLVMMGTGPFAVPTFRALLDSPNEVVALVTQPARVGRGNRPAPPSPMRQVALERGTPVYDPESINTDAAREILGLHRAELFVVADYGQILSPETLSVAPRGGINLHGSLLPKYRGAAPINWAIYHGDPETGVTVIQMSPRVDAGGTLARATTAIRTDENAVELEQRLAELGAPLICEVIHKLKDAAILPQPQDPALATPARRLRKTDGEVDWTRSAEQIRNQIRAFEPWPRTSTTWFGVDREPLRLILSRAEARGAQEGKGAAPGTVTSVGNDEFCVATGDGGLAIRELQPAGKRAMPAAEFLRGNLMTPGDRCGPYQTRVDS